MNFSVLLSLYHKEKENNLNDCLKSIELNTLKPTQIVIVYDGIIPQELDNVVHEYLDQLNIDIIKIDTNVGLGNALNIGLKECKYNIVIRMDTDDICLPNRFEAQIEFLEKNPNISLFGTAIEEFDETMNFLTGVRAPPLEHGNIIQYSKKRNPFNHMTVAFNKEIIQHVGGYQHHLYMEDYNLWIRVIAAGYKVANLQDCLVRVRGGDSMITRRKGITYIKSEFQLAKLKIEKKIDTPLNSYLNFALRSIPRLLPTSILSKIYKKLRK